MTCTGAKNEEAIWISVKNGKKARQISDMSYKLHTGRCGEKFEKNIRKFLASRGYNAGNNAFFDGHEINFVSKKGINL